MSDLTEQITQIKDTVDIVQVISETVKLKPSSHGYVGLCPFHQEDTPSFHVYSDTNSYYCFGCQKGGNVFTYLMEKEHINFYEALQILADRAGISLDTKNSLHSHNSHDCRDILKLAEDFFAEHLRTSNAAQIYLQKRSLTNSDIRKFNLGYAPDAWDALTLHLRKHGCNDTSILASGLSVQSRTGIYDRFRGRIIFPIRDITGRTIAFGGRILSGEGAKYINSPESELYRKRKNLYLLDMARNAIREKKRSILCEGYMDALRLQKSGFHESVASLGTSLTAEQADLLSRYSDRCYICYDADSAGQKAAIRGMYILQSHGLDVRVINLPEGKDPDEYLRSHSAEEFEELIEKAKPLILAHIASMRARLNDVSTRKSAIKELFGSLESLSAGEVLEYKSQLCEATRLLPSDLERMLVTKSDEITRQEGMPQIRVTDETLECGICALLMKREELRVKLEPEELRNIMNSPDVRDLALSLINEDVKSLSELWLETGDTDKFSMIQRGENICRQMLGLSDEEKFTRIYSALKRISIERRISEINAQDFSERDYVELNELYLEREKYSL